MEGTVIERLIVEWRADYEKFARDTARIKAYLGDTKAAAKTTSSEFAATGASSSSLGSAFAALGLKAMLLGTALKALRSSVSGIGEAIQLAMDVTESESLFETSLGSMSNSVRAWSESMAESLGVNADEIRRTTGLWYTLGKSLELDSDTALDMSKSLQQLKFDLMSFYNIDGSQADTIIQGMYSGETEPAKRIGVLLTEEVAKRALLTRGIVEEGQEIDSVTKLQGRYLALMDQTKTAQGDMARTIESPSNQMRILESQFRAAKLELGQAFLPVLQEAMPVLKNFASGLKDIAEATGKIIEVFMGRKTFGLKKEVSSVGSATAAGAVGWNEYGDAAGKALDKASAGAAKLKATIFGFDLLNVMGGDKTIGDAATGGSAGQNNLLPNLTDNALPEPENQDTSTGINKEDPVFDPSLWMEMITGGNYRDTLDEIDLLPFGISQNTYDNLKSFLQLLADTRVTINEWAWSNRKITNEMAKVISETTLDMAEKVKVSIQDQTDTSYKTMADYFAKSNELTEEEEASILGKIKQSGLDRQNVITEMADRITEIYTNAANDHREITFAEREEILKLQDDMKNEAIGAMSESADEQRRILEYLKDNVNALTAQQAADTVKNSYAAKEAAIKNANETADKVILAAWHQREAGSITEDEYKKIVDAANKARDDSIKAAEDTHKKVVSEAKLQAKEHVNEVNWETGEIKSTWQMFIDSISGFFKSLGDAWRGLVSFFSEGYQGLSDTYGQSGITGKNSSGITGVKMNTYAAGGLPEVGEIFIAREAGPESVGRIGNKAAVANNDQIVSAFETAFYRAARASQATGNNGGPIQLQVVVGNKTVYDILIDEATRQNIRTGKQVIQVEA